MILAGGRATRMGGGDKPLLQLGRTTMLGRITACLDPQAEPLAINANGDPARFAEYGLPVLPDSLPDHPGPLAGILAAMDWAAGIGADRVVTVAGDTPFVPGDLVSRLAAAAGPRGLAIAASRNADGSHDHPVIGLWPVRLRSDLRARLLAGNRRVRALTDAHKAARAEWSALPHDPFRNVNTPEDLAAARSALD
ncbi:molybdenum cofactor guanylyltransferase MobA [Paracoccus sp. 1_MG-2023]|nr:molybdenum cofactor guanylyltransferase MobA [Paracoccus sp. 1_MG-2023]MDO6667917.1 molybdenum cofactor guanylyltransferase MobA [Paracoccus sp. 1_MG-2023]